MLERKAKSRRGQCGRGNDGHGVKEVMMVQRDLMSVLMFIEDSTLAASGQPAQEVKNTLGNLVRKIISSHSKLERTTGKICFTIFFKLRELH